MMGKPLDRFATLVKLQARGPQLKNELIHRNFVGFCIASTKYSNNNVCPNIKYLFGNYLSSLPNNKNIGLFCSVDFQCHILSCPFDSSQLPAFFVGRIFKSETNHEE